MWSLGFWGLIAAIVIPFIMFAIHTYHSDLADELDDPKSRQRIYNSLADQPGFRRYRAHIHHFCARLQT